MTESKVSEEDKLHQLFTLAVERFEAHDYTGAETVLEDLLSKAPGHPQILNYLAVTVHLRGDFVRARKLLKHAINVMPDFLEAWNNLGLLSLEHGSFKTAEDAFQKTCHLSPNTSTPFINLAHVLHADQRCNEAIEAYQKGLAIQPDHPTAWTALSRALLIEGRWKEAGSAADRQIALRPGHTVALALKSVALQELKEKKTWKKLVDFEQLIECFKIDVPQGYADLHAFNNALTDFCLKHPSLVYTPEGKSTELGFQTDSLTEETESPVADLLQAIKKCTELYLSKRSISLDHPFLSQRPSFWRHDIWATVLDSGGHQGSHIHRDGWLSGVYYVQTPTVINSQESSCDTAGWIEFGRPVIYPKARAEPVTKRYPPSEGCLYLFPSYFYHRTIPFFSDSRRISIAFDLIDGPIKRQARYIDYVDG